jgi:NAD(P)-dependent dehydrogenase (short-subunit alcohol dehydrogenase family)
VKDQVIVITGGGRGIGRAFALALAKTGATIVVTGRNAAPLETTVELVESDGGRATAVSSDVADQKSVDRAFDEILAKHGRVDVLVNNAGVPGTIDLMWRADPDSWWRTMEINLRGCFLWARAVLPRMVERSAGRIVNIVSHAGVFRWPYLSDYSVSKAALIKLTENLAVETRRYNVAAFAFHPGFVKGGFCANLPEVDPPADTPAAKMLAWTRKELASDRAVTPEQSAAGVVKLVSGKYDALSGRYLTVADDLDALLARASEVQRKDLLTLRLSS